MKQVSTRALMSFIEGEVVQRLGAEDRVAFHVLPAETCTEASLVFAPNQQDIDRALERGCAILIADQRALAHIESMDVSGARSPSIGIVNDLALCRAWILKEFFYSAPKERVIFPPFLSHETQNIHSSVQISPHATIGEDVSIGENTWVGPGCVVENGVSIGTDGILHAQVFIGHDTSIGNRVELHAGVKLGADGYAYVTQKNGQHLKIPQVGIVVIEDDVEIGANSCIDRAALETTRVGQGTKIDNLVHIAHNCQIGKNCLITAGFMTGGSSHFGDGVIAGGHVTVKDHTHIGSGVILGGFSCVTGDLTEPGLYSGYPARPIAEAFKILATQAYLPEMRKMLKKLMRQVNP